MRGAMSCWLRLSQLLPTERFVVSQCAGDAHGWLLDFVAEGAIGFQVVCEQREKAGKGRREVAAKSAQAVCRLSEQLRLPIVRV